MKNLIKKIEALFERVENHEVDNHATELLLLDIKNLCENYFDYDNLLTEKVYDIVFEIKDKVSKLEPNEQPNMDTAVRMLENLKKWLENDSVILKNYLDLHSVAWNLVIELKKQNYRSKDLDNLIEIIDRIND